MKQSNRKKGGVYELRAKKELEAQGLIVEKANARIVWIKGRPHAMHHDFFGIGDLLYFSKEKSGIVQVKFQDENTGLWLAEVRRKMIAFECPHWFSREIWVYRKEGHRIVKSIEVVKDIADTLLVHDPPKNGDDNSPA